jgi:biopolymer transport protein ExbB
MITLRRIELFVVLVVFVAALVLTRSVPAQTPPAAPGAGLQTPAGPESPPATTADDSTKADTARNQAGFLELIWASGWVGFVIIFLSIAAVAMAIEHVMTLRAPVLMPPGLAEQVRDLLAAGRLAQAQEACHQQPSFLAYVLEAGMAEIDGGWAAIEKAMEDAIAEQSARLFRKIEYLSVIGSLAPMLGLLGTVIGMVMAFREVAATQGAARAADLAQGIYLALVTTVEGLIVAIPALGVFAIFRNRLDQLVAATARVAEHVFLPLKRRRVAPRQAVPPPPPGGPA